MTQWLQRASLALILLVAAALRLTGMDWDNYDHHHPDERYITWVATTIEWPSDLKEVLNPIRSSLNPFYWSPDAESKGIVVPSDEPRKFAYGHLPLYMGVAATRAAERMGPVLAPLLPSKWLFTSDILNGSEMIEYRHLTAVTRALTALVDVGTVALLFFLGKRLYGFVTGLLASSFLALNVMHIQLAHFFAFDPYLTFFVVAAVTFMVFAVTDERLPPERSGGVWSKCARIYLLLASLCVGLAVASKFAGILLFLPLLLTLYLKPMLSRLRWPLAVVAIALFAFVVTNPFAVLDMTCELITPSVKLGPFTIPALDWRSCFLDNVSTQGAMARGDIVLPFTRQYAGTVPYLYFIEMQLRSGMGPLLGLVSFTGFGWAIWQGVAAALRWLQNERQNGRSFSKLNLEPLWRSHGSIYIMMAWTVPFFVTTGGFYVKFMRYMQPLIPFLMLYGAAMIGQWGRPKWRRAVMGSVIVFTGLYSISFVRMYRQPHPWTAASKWIYANVEEGSLILSEKWDDALPVSLVVDDVKHLRSEYENEQLTWLSGTGTRDDVEKLESNVDLLAEADYLTLVTNRVYGVVPRLPEQYPLSSQFYPLLFDGSLGYEIAAVFGRFPNLFGYQLKPDTFSWPGLEPGSRISEWLSMDPGLNWGRVDESFTVYDQPLTMIFRNVGGKSPSEILRLFDLD